MKDAIAIIGMACEFPGAHSPQELWENVLAGRKAFRRMPNQRLNLDDYMAEDPSSPDRTYLHEAAVIEGYAFDRVAFRVSGETFRSADLVHWLALDVADRALRDAGYPKGKGLSRQATGVLIGNSLAGEFSRAGLMRLRWPYVRRVLGAGLVEEGWGEAERLRFLARMEAVYKQPFPDVGEETLAGGLANTVAGRICNYFNFRGGGYTVDGACASSLLAVANACSALLARDIEVAVVGGVDLSLDPFELVGFAKTGALARDVMRVFDQQPTGFLPGEGCGILILKPYEEARAEDRKIYAVIRGWGVSSDGKGGLTRPEPDGQLLALHRAYRRARFQPGTVAYFEGHGTGTDAGDEAELKALIALREGDAIPAALGSVKANIGHTKAAAGVAGLIKTAMALRNQVLPPTTSCPHPRDLLQNSGLYTPEQGRLWPETQPLRAGVSAMGFGGINAHLALEGFYG